jgi:MOSC domain-containing protein YiiM
MKLLSVNIGKPRVFDGDAMTARPTGIYKVPAVEPVQITTDGIIGDAICDTENHGGVDQAVYVYGAIDYAWWENVLGRTLSPGTFGENLTISELESSNACVGDRFHVGSVVLEVTAPRVPCGTLSRRMNDTTFAARFREAERPGLYCRVIEPGYLQAGTPVVFERYSGNTITALEMFRVFYACDLDEATLRRHLSAPIGIRDRIEYERLLQKLLSATPPA